MRSRPGAPMTLANMRRNGVRMVVAICASCDALTVPRGSFVRRDR
jgi:hypothetical protein